MRKFWLLLVVIISAIGLIACSDDTSNSGGTADSTKAEGGADGPPAEVTEWVFQPAFDSGDAGWDNGIVPWIEAVEEATEGSIEIELLPAGSIVSGGEAFGATSDGTLDGYAGWATVYGGLMPEGMLAYGLAMGAEDHEEAWEALWGNPDYQIGEIVQEAANNNNLQWVGWTSQGPNSIFTKFPVEKMEDLEGHKLRAGGPQALFLETMGGIPVSFEGDEIYTALDLGTIEGTMWDTGGVASMKFNEVIDYAMMPGWNPSQAQEIYVNLDAWNALNDWQREKIEGIFEETYFQTSEMHLEGVEASLQAIKDSGGEIITLSDEEIAKMRAKAIEEIWPKVAGESELTAKGVELYKQFLTDKGKIEE
jgi:TRAP-type C4-dicarboxylate transport system substrate-binding protein